MRCPLLTNAALGAAYAEFQALRDLEVHTRHTVRRLKAARIT